MWVAKNFNSKTSPVVDYITAGTRVADIVLVHFASFFNDLDSPSIDGETVVNGQFILSVYEDYTAPFFVQVPFVHRPQPLSEGVIVLVTGGLTYRNHLFIVVAREGSLRLEAIANTGESTGSRLITAYPPPENVNARVLISPTNVLKYVDTTTGAVRIQSNSSQNSVTFDLAFQEGDAVVPPTTGLLTLGLNNSGYLHMRTREKTDRVTRWRIGLRDSWFWMGFGWQDVEWTMNDLDVRSISMSSSDTQNVCPCLQYRPSGINQTGDGLLVLHNLPPTNMLPPFDLEFTIRMLFPQDIKIILSLTCMEQNGFLAPTPQFQGTLNVPAMSASRVRVQDWIYLADGTSMNRPHFTWVLY